MRQIVAGMVQRSVDRRETALFLRRAFRLLHFNRIEGDYVEFGCQQFQSFPLAWKAIQGQPLDRRLWAVGNFDRIPKARTARDLHPRWVAETPVISEQMFRGRCLLAGIPRSRSPMIRVEHGKLAEADELPDKIAFVWINAQPFSDIRSVLRWLEPRLSSGMMLAFEHYFCSSRFERSGARNALLELKASRPDLGFVEYRRFGLAGLAFMVEDA